MSQTKKASPDETNGPKAIPQSSQRRSSSMELWLHFRRAERLQADSAVGSSRKRLFQAAPRPRKKLRQ